MAEGKELALVRAFNGSAHVERWKGSNLQEEYISYANYRAGRQSIPSVVFATVNPKRKIVSLTVEIGSEPVSAASAVRELREYLAFDQETHLSVFFLRQRRNLSDDYFPNQNPIFGDWPVSREELAGDKVTLCVSPAWQSGVRSETQCNDMPQMEW
jgi:hypothetical protein